MKVRIKERLKELRKDKNLTQKQIAKILNKSETGYASWEQGLSEPCINDLITISEYYGVTIDYLVGKEDMQPTQYFLCKFFICGYQLLLTKTDFAFVFSCFNCIFFLAFLLYIFRLLFRLYKMQYILILKILVLVLKILLLMEN